MDTNTPPTPGTPDSVALPAENTTPSTAAIEPQKDRISLSWTAHIVPQHERSRRWYLIGGITVLAAVLLGLFTANWIFSFVCLLIALLYYLQRNAPPVIKTIELTEKGVTFDGAFTRWDDCRDFWILTLPDYSELHMDRKKGGLTREIVIHTEDVPTDSIRQTLTQFLPERSQQRERIVDMIIRLCKL